MQQTEEVEVHINPERFSIEELVRNATWREILVDLVERNKLDPWDIDIGKVVDGYVSIVKQMKVLDLYVPANIILAASILLRMKSETITSLLEERNQEPEAPEMEQIRARPEVPELMYTSRLRPGRRITLDDLMGALDEAMKSVHMREEIAISESTPVPLVLNSYDIDSKMEETKEMLKRSTDSYGKATFSGLAKQFSSLEATLLDLFVPLLFLSQKGVVSLEQETFFGEIIITLKQHQLAEAKAVENDGR
jgi:segregation and condensation protein A